MRRQIRIFLGMTILILSIALLIWGLLPARREVRTQPISPTDLQLPTPVSFDLRSTVTPALACGASVASHEVAKQSPISLMKIEYEIASSGRYARRYRVSTPSSQ